VFGGIAWIERKENAKPLDRIEPEEGEAVEIQDQIIAS
jgi:hypothetical protein